MFCNRIICEISHSSILSERVHAEFREHHGIAHPPSHQTYPTENVWQVMRNCVEKNQPGSTADWKATVMNNFMGLDLSYIDNLVDSMHW